MCVHELMHVSAAGDAWGVPRWCMPRHCEAQNGKMCKNTHTLNKICETCSFKNKPKQWNSFESKTPQECHMNILSNI